MKVCILSMQRVQNAGSLLQSYALKRMLEQLGHTVSFLDIEPNREENQLLIGKRNLFPYEGEVGGDIFSKLKKIDKYTINRLRNKRKAGKQNQVFEDFRASVLQMDRNAGSDHYDCCVIGSDEVFNCLSGASWGFTSQLFGNVKQADRVITYAASCGATVYEDVPEQVLREIRKAFGGVAAFSVRDENTYRFVSRLTGKTVLEHLDPVLVGDFREEIEAAQLPEALPKNYCVVYSYFNRISDQHEIASIRQFCKKHGMEMLAVGAPQKWIKNYPVQNPFEMLKVFQNAAFVITDTFHGTIFSAKLSRRFAVMVRGSNENKLKDLIGRLGLDGHLVTSMDRLDDVYCRVHDPNRFEEAVNCERKRSIQYLADHITKKEQ